VTKIYLSSTYGDLVEYRETVVRALRTLENAEIRAMEDYVARDERPLDKCLQDVGWCDVYIGIFAHRYGHIPSEKNPQGKSITELEYRRAVEAGKYKLLFLLDEQTAWKPGFSDWYTKEGEQGERVHRLRDEISQEKLVSFFQNPDQLASRVLAAVANYDEQHRPRSVSLETQLNPETPALQPRELKTHLLLCYYETDTNLADALASSLRARGWNTLLAPRALHARQPVDFQRLETTLRQCHMACVVLSDRALARLSEEPAHSQRILDMLRARTGWLIAASRNPLNAGQSRRLGFSDVLELSAWQPGATLPDNALLSIDQALSAAVPVTDIHTIGLPFTVLAMTHSEAQALVEQPEMIEQELGSQALEQFRTLQADLERNGVTSFAKRYADDREGWQPFGEPSCTIQTLIGEIVSALNHSYHPGLRGRAIKIQHYPFDALVNKEPVLSMIYRNIAQTGCVVVLDELSLYHPRLRTALLASSFASSPQVAMVTIAPLNPYRLPPYNQIESELRRRLAAAFDRFALDYDPQCEFSVGDERRFKRWLHSSIPQTLQTLREPQPDRTRIAAFADELGQQPDRKVAGLLYSEGGIL
jgi:hypothetical protein